MGAKWSRSKMRRIVKSFGLRMRRIRPYASLYRTDAAFRIWSGQGEWMLKPFSGRPAARRKSSVAACIGRLEESNYPHMPRWRTTGTGSYWLTSKGTAYYMTEWVKGRKLSPDPADLQALGQALGKLHALRISRSRGNRAPTEKQMVMLKRQDRRFRRHLSLFRHSHTSAARWFKSHSKECEALSVDAWPLLERGETRAILGEEANHPSYIHGDITLPNIVVTAEGVKLIDWDSARAGSAYFEIAKTLANVTGFRPKLMKAFLQGYEQIRPLRAGERLLIAGLYRLPREAWYSAASLVRGTGHPVFRIVKRTWKDRLNAVRWMDQWAVNRVPDGAETAAVGQETPNEPLQR